jgi:hypothetical protein
MSSFQDAGLEGEDLCNLRLARCAADQVVYEIRGSYGGEDVDVGLVRRNFMWTNRKIQTFLRNTLPPRSASET